jgi:hypothetical protein
VTEWPSKLCDNGEISAILHNMCTHRRGRPTAGPACSLPEAGLPSTSCPPPPFAVAHSAQLLYRSPTACAAPPATDTFRSKAYRRHPQGHPRNWRPAAPIAHRPKPHSALGCTKRLDRYNVFRRHLYLLSSAVPLSLDSAEVHGACIEAVPY